MDITQIIQEAVVEGVKELYDLDTSIDKIDYSLIRFIKDRKAHDRRYAMDFTKLKSELGWTPKINFEQGITQTIKWYLNNIRWVRNITSGDYKEYYKKMYGEIS